MASTAATRAQRFPILCYYSPGNAEEQRGRCEAHTASEPLGVRPELAANRVGNRYQAQRDKVQERVGQAAAGRDASSVRTLLVSWFTGSFGQLSLCLWGPEIMESASLRPTSAPWSLPAPKRRLCAPLRAELPTPGE